MTETNVYPPLLIAQINAGAGFSGEDLITSVAVVLAESGGNAKVVNRIGCVGWFQINQPVHVKAHPTWTRAYLQDPRNNAKAAYALFVANGKRWSPTWEAYTNQSYRMYLSTARKAVGELANGGGAQTAPPTPKDDDHAITPFEAIIKMFQLLTDPHTYVRYGWYMAGGILVIYGLMKMTGDNNLSTASKVAVAAVTKGKVPA